MTGQRRFTLKRSRRRTLAIEVTATGEVIVRAPYRMPNAEILGFVSDKEDWIADALKKQAERGEALREVTPLTVPVLEELFEEARRVIPKRVAHYAAIMGVTYGRITIRNQRTRWGSCSSKGNLNFNCLLMLAPSEVLDYVVVHELAHRIEMNHSKAFWAIVARVFPDYAASRRWLKENGRRLEARNP